MEWTQCTFIGRNGVSLEPTCFTCIRRLCNWHLIGDCRRSFYGFGSCGFSGALLRAAKNLYEIPATPIAMACCWEPPAQSPVSSPVHSLITILGTAKSRWCFGG